jgi:hypothetical protein
MQPQRSVTHDPVQQSVPAVHAAPMILQEAALSHRSGFPAQVPAQHSSLVAQEAPAAMQVEVQTLTPAELALHVPSQQVSPAAQGAPRGRHGPEPKSQRPLTESQAPQQGGIAAPVHVSPVSRHSDGASEQNPSTHVFEQQSPSVLHVLPAVVQSVVPQVPPLHPREQQSVAAVQGSPSTTQYGAHAFSADTESGSHRPLQQSLRSLHCAPGPPHDPLWRQTLLEHRPEQQSEFAPQAVPLPRQVGAVEQAASSLTAASKAIASAIHASAMAASAMAASGSKGPGS